MKLKSKLGYLFLLCLWVGMSTSMAQNITHEGREFWVTFPRHEPNGSVLATMKLFITAKADSKGMIKVGTDIIPFTVRANKTTAVDIPRSLTYLSHSGYFSGRAIQVLVNPDEPQVVVHAHINASARSAATLV